MISVKPVTDPSFAAVTAYPVYEAELSVVSTFKGTASKTVRFRHYAQTVERRHRVLAPRL